MGQMSGLRARQQKALENRFLDLKVPGLPGITARFRTLTPGELQRAGELVDKAKDKEAANRIANSRALAGAFLQLRQGDEILADGITDDLIEEFCPDIVEPSNADVMLGLFTDGLPLYRAGARLTDWSTGEEDEDTEALTGN